MNKRAGGGIYGYSAPGPTTPAGRLIAALLGLALASIIATNILTFSWGAPAGARLLTSTRVSRLVCASALLAFVVVATWRRGARPVAFAGMGVAVLIALTPLYSPFIFWQVAAQGLQGLLTGAAGLRVLLAAMVGGGVGGVFTFHVLRLIRLREGGVKGSTRWGDGAALKGKEEGFLLGIHDDTFLRYTGSGHLMTVAATRSGKGVGSIIPNLLDHPGSIVVTDPKGENHYVTARYRRDVLGHDVVAMDPFGITLAKPMGFNPLDLIDFTGSDYVETAMMMAEMMIVKTTGGGDQHWVREGKSVLYTFILHAATLDEPEKRNLVEVRRMLTQDPDDFRATIMKMSESDIAQVREGAGRMQQKADRELSGVLSTVQSYTHFLSSPRMEQVLTQTEFSMGGVVQDNLSLYLVLPMEHLTAFAPWMRLMVACAYYACTHDVIHRERSEHRILFMLDEFANLGYMSNIKSAFSLGGGYGVTMWLILQDLAQLKQAYRDEWESFVANSDVFQAFAIQDPFSADKVSRMLGQTTVWQRKTRKSTRREGGRLIRDYDEDSRPLLRPEELRRLHPDRSILLVRPYQPIAATKIRYYRDEHFSGRWDKNPYIT